MASPTPSDESAAAGAAPADEVDFAEVIKFSTRGNRWLVMLRSPVGKALDRFLVRWVGWSVVTWGYAKAAGNPYQPTMLLHTIGRKTGTLRTSTLPYYRVGDDLIVCGSNGGGPKDPMWVGNIRGDSHCWLRIGRRFVPATGHVALGEEREALFPVVAELHPGLERYQTQSSSYGRDVPLVVLTPRQPIPARGR
jgi:deazaflavin-dependent oxidoreductase (nitroreductase family)